MILKSTQKDFNFIKYRLKTSTNRVRQKQKQNQNKLGLGPQGQNPLYKYMKHQRTNTQVVDPLIHTSLLTTKKSDGRRTQSQKFILQKTHAPNFNVFAKRSRSRSSKDIESLRVQGETLYQKVDGISYFLKRKKEQLKLLDKYIDKVDRYCSFIPKTYEQNQKEIMIAHEEVRKLCTEQVFKEDSISDRVPKVMTYSEPKINFKIYQKNKDRFKRHRRISTAPIQDVQSSLTAQNFTVNI